MPDNPYDASVDRRKKKALRGLQDLDDLKAAKARGANPATTRAAKLARASLKRKAARAAAIVSSSNTPSVTTMTNANAKVTITSPLALNPGNEDSIVMEAHGDANPFIEVFKTPEAIPRDGQIGALVFAKGIAYIRTRGGIVNLGEALEHADPIFITKEQKMDKDNDRRSAIAAQKAKKKDVT